MPKYDSLELGADSQLKYFAGYTTQGGAALSLAELNGSSVALPITSTPLAASANFTGTTQDRLNVTAGATAVSGGIPLAQQAGVLVSKVKGSVYSDQAGTLYVEESNDNSTWTQTTTLAVSAGIFADTGWVYLSKRYYRLRYANGASAQNTFSLFQSVGAGQSDVQLMGSNAPDTAAAPKLIGTFAFGLFTANSTVINRMLSVLTRNAKHRTFIVKNTLNVPISQIQFQFYDSTLNDSLLQGDVYKDTVGMANATSYNTYTSEANPILSAHFDSLRLNAVIGATAPTSGNLYLYVTEVI